MASTRHELTTKDGTPIDDLLEMARRAVDIYREAEKPFREMFAETVDQQTFFQEAQQDDFEWEEVTEGEAPRTVVQDENEGKWMTIRAKKFAKSLGFTQEYIEDHTEEQVMRKVRTMLSGALTTEQNLIRNTFHDNLLDGTQENYPWYDIPDYGDFTFDDGHQHAHSTSEDLFGDTNAHAVREHIEEAKRDLTHHGFDGPFVGLVSPSLKRKLKDELSWDASYHIPMATGMRETDVHDLDITIDGVGLTEADWMAGDKLYVTQAQNGSPVKFYPKREPQITRPNGGVVRHPGELIGASGTARYGCRMVDPLRVVYVEPDNIA